MRILYPLFILISFFGLQHTTTIATETNTRSSLAQDWVLIKKTEIPLKVVRTIALLGSVYSFLFWLPNTIDVIKHYGILKALHSTHIPRLLLDATIIGLCVYDLLKKN